MASSTSRRVSGRTLADPVSTRDAVAGDTPACWATSASLGRNFVSMPDTPASSPAIAGAGRFWPAGSPAPQRRTAQFRGAPGKCFWCVTVLQLSVEYSGQPDPGVKGFRKAGLTRDVVL